MSDRLAPRERGVVISSAKTERKYFPESEWTRGFEWFKQPATVKATSAVFRAMVRSIALHPEEMKGMHGILFSNNVFAWSKDSPDHEALEEAFKGDYVQDMSAVLRRRGEMEITSATKEGVIIDVRGWDRDALRIVASYIKRNTEASADKAIITIYPFVQTQRGTVSVLYMGYLEGYREGLF